jgi:8-oxo-dGTP pyrophosphatase MutT (NUDIX family)
MPLTPYGTLAARLKQKLAGPLPGMDAQYEMAPSGRQRINIKSLAAGTYVESAVLILVCADGSGRLFIPLIERPEYEGVHSGQIALPGGKKDEADRSLQDTAKRECHEELSVGNDCEILGSLTPIFIPVSGYLVHPFVGFSENAASSMRPDSREVRSVVKLYLEDLLAESVRTEKEVRAGSTALKAPCFDVDCHAVWGATAMILNEFRHVLLDVIGK